MKVSPELRTLEFIPFVGRGNMIASAYEPNTLTTCSAL